MVVPAFGSENSRATGVVAQPAEPTKAIHYSHQAGDAALAALAPGDALDHYTRAINLHAHAHADDSDPTLAIDLAIGLGTAQFLIGDPAFRETLLAAAHQAADHNDTDRLVAAALANNRGVFSSAAGTDNERVEILEIALGRLAEDSPDRPLILAALCAEVTVESSLEHRKAIADEALALARLTGDDAIQLRVLNHIFIPLFAPPLLESAALPHCRCTRPSRTHRRSESAQFCGHVAGRRCGNGG